MRAASIALLVIAAALAAAGCSKPQQPEQNIVIDNGVDANADIETLPPDESSGTSSNELSTGNDNPGVNDLNTSNSH